MRKARLWASTTILVLGASLIACSGYKNPDAVSQRVTQVTGVPFEQLSTVTIGRSAFRIARFASKAADAPPPALIKDLDDLQWGTYRPLVAESASAGMPGLNASHFIGYSPIFARKAETGENLILLSRGSGERIHEILFVVDGSEQLTIIQVRGRLEALLEDAIRLALGEAQREDLVDEAVRSLGDSQSIDPSG